MPPKTRGNKAIKTLKENVNVVQKTKPKVVSKVSKPPRKALADKTNSASDDNASMEAPITQKTVNTSHSESENPPRSRRERRLPFRYVEMELENKVLKTLSNCRNTESQVANAVSIPKTNQQSNLNDQIPIKLPISTETPQDVLECSLVANRPKRICRLPSKFDDHITSPSKNLVVQPCHASTPILQSKQPIMTSVKDKKKNNFISNVNKEVSKMSVQKRHNEDSSDSNNNAKRRLRRNREEVKSPENPVPLEHKISPEEKISPRLKANRRVNKKLQEKSFSFRVLEDRKKSSKRDASNIDIYEFTYDPNEEPPPAKKKRKKTIRKKPTQPRTVVFKNNYDKNVAKALEALKKSVVSKKSDVPEVVVTAANDCSPQSRNKHTVESSIPETTEARAEQVPQVSTCNNLNAVGLTPITNQTANITNEDRNYNSVRVEDIAADFDISMDNYNDIDYSPVNSPNCAKAPLEVNRSDMQTSVHSKDPLNLRDDLSFFGDNPIASSSMNMSARHPHASPWRVEFNNLPIKWQANTYIKANMTPAVESSFINVEEKKKKHVYTNIMAEDNEPMSELESNKSPYLKQTSIMSFIREVVERSAKKKNKALTATPSKEKSLFKDVASESAGTIDKTPKKLVNDAANDKNVHKRSAEKNLSSDDKENSNEIMEPKKKVKSTPKDKNGTFFGFDDTEDQENVSPEIINNPKVRSLRPRARAVLQEINAMSGPMRAELPVAARSKVTTSADAVNKVYEEITAADAPIFPEKDNGEPEQTNDDADTDVGDHNSPSMHLFEDIEPVHHLKPSRKSYGKAKKVTFHQQTSPMETLDLGGRAHESSDEDDLADLTFTMPSVQQKKPKKKPTKKQLMAKKEEQAMEAWAAGFNSMCEDIEEFPLVVE